MAEQDQIQQKTEQPEDTAARVWLDFVAMLQTGQVASIRIRPYHSALLDPIRTVLADMSRSAIWREWTVIPEIHRVEQQVHFMLDLTLNHERDTYCFSFLLEDETWSFQHVETITLRLDQLDPLPTCRFPTLPEQKKAWMHEEIRVTEMVRLFNWLVQEKALQEKGRDFAFHWFQDGEGYVLAAKTWVPFVPAHRAFILYLCWEQSNLRGSNVTLLELNDQVARVDIIPIDFLLYQQTGHLQQQIAFQDYRCLYETIWVDRARKAGWEVAFAYQNEVCAMLFQKSEIVR